VANDEPNRVVVSMRRDIAWYATILGTIIAVLGFFGYRNYGDVLGLIRKDTPGLAVRSSPTPSNGSGDAATEVKTDLEITLEFWPRIVEKARASPSVYPHELIEAIDILGTSGSVVAEETLTSYLATDCAEKTSSDQINVCHEALKAIQQLAKQESCDDLAKLRLRNSMLAGHAKQIAAKICH
jgi:hypothetical protein